MTAVAWFEELGRDDVARAGGKGANLGEMTRAGLPVPPGFVVAVDAYRRFLTANALEAEIARQLEGLAVDAPDRLRQAAEALQSRLRAAPVPADVRKEIVAAYDELTRREGGGEPRVAVRSSATVEDTARSSYAGMFQSYLNVRGAEAVTARVRDCWASLFGERILFYRVAQGITGDVSVGVVVQSMVESEKAGVLFTVDPTTHDADHLVIEAAFGLGEVVVAGQVNPDRYLVDKDTGEVLDTAIGQKDFMLAFDAERGLNTRVPLEPDRAGARVLDADEIETLRELAVRDERHYGAPQDLEFAIADGKVWVVQTRPVTTLAEPTAAAGPGPGPAAQASSAGEPRVLVRGLGASPGVATGRARVIATPADGASLLAGEILITTLTSPDWVPIMRRAAAIVTDSGGMTSHAAIVSRELGIPCVVGTREGSRQVKEGTTITVDGRTGAVLEGAVERPVVAVGGAAGMEPGPAAATSGTGGAGAPSGEAALSGAPRRGGLRPGGSPPPVTATRLYVNLAEPQRAEEVAALAVDGVGLLRAEFMLLEALDNTHPRVLLEEGRGEEFVRRLAAGVARIASAFHPRPVIYRATDFRSNEFRGLRGGERFEPQEANPMIGYRGCYRYVREPELFALELKALAAVRADLENVHLMIPFVRTEWEFRACRELVERSGLLAGRPMELWVMAEVPSVVHWLERYVALGATGVSIGSNDLTQLVLGVDRDSELVARLFDERDGAVLETIHAIIRECRRLGVTCSICGQAPSVYPEYAERLVEWGIDSVSVNPDAVEVARRHIGAAEQRLLLEEARTRECDAQGERRPARELEPA